MAAFLLPAVIIAVLVLLNGLFVAAEFAIVGAPRASIEAQTSRGSALARRVRDILQDTSKQDRYIATTQVGITVASLGLGMYGEHALADGFAALLARVDLNLGMGVHAIASVVAITLLTYVHIVIGEMVPKALALQRPERTVLYVTPMVQAVQACIRPLVAALNGIGNRVLMLLGVRRQEGSTERFYTTGELQYIIEESHDGGQLRGEAGTILRELFEFGDLRAGEVMVPRVRVIGVPVGATSDDLRRIVRAHPHTRYPVFAGDLDHIAGSLHIKSLLQHLVSGEPVHARDAAPLPYVPASAPLDQVLGSMRRHQAQMAVVMDEHGGTVGLVTIEDLFEEVVGEIGEERGAHRITRLDHGRIRAAGTVRLSDVSKALGSPLEHPDASSVSGLMLAVLGRPPAPGDTVTWKHARFEVTAVAGRGVGEAIVTLTEPPLTEAAREPR